MRHVFFQSGLSGRTWMILLLLTSLAGLGTPQLHAQVPAVLPTPTPGPQAVAPPASAPAALPGDNDIKTLIQQTAPTPSNAPLVVLPPPVGCKVTTIHEGVFVEWDALPSALGAVSYNVYRSQFPGGGYNMINSKPVTAAHFLDGPGISSDAPKEGETYFYVVTSVQPQGGVSPYSEEVNLKVAGLGTAGATPTPMPGDKKDKDKQDNKPQAKEVELPESNLVKLKLPADSQLSIQGYKKIETLFSSYHYFRPSIGNQTSTVSTTSVNQELVVNVNGKIGDNVDVHVDYSDVNRTGGLTDNKQEISIVYHGDPDSAIQEVAFGDLLLSIPNTEFAGFSKQLFGIQAKAKVDRLKVTSLFAQTKGITETKTFRGSYVQNDKVLQDTDFIHNKYYLITKQSELDATGKNLAFPQNGGEQIWMDDGNPYNNTGGADFIGSYQKLAPGIDYTMDYSTGIVNFLKGVSTSYRIVAGMTQRDASGTKVGFDGAGNIDLSGGLVVPANGVLSNSAHLIKDNTDPSVLSPLYLPNMYSLGSDKIIPPEQDSDFLFEIVNQGTNQIEQSGQSGFSRWRFKMDLDQNLLTVSDSTNVAFPERPFMGDSTMGGTAINEPYSVSEPSSKYHIHVKYKTRVDFFRLDRINIVSGSESVFVDGKRLRRDADYNFDYTSGYLSFQDPTLLRPDSEIVVTYEYSNVAGSGQSSIFGTRLEYDLTDHLFLGSTYLYSGAQKPQDVPQIGSTPDSINLFDADIRYELTRDMIHSATSMVPGLGKVKVPIDTKFSAEIAKSYFSPNNFSMEGETGVALVDNMEGVESTIAASSSVANWISSSAPVPLSFLNGGVSYIAGAVAANNRVRFRNGSATYHENASNDGGPGGGGHLFVTTNNVNDRVQTMNIPYSALNNQRWAGVRTLISKDGTDATGVKFVESWIYGDGQDKWVVFDFGTISEDSTDEGLAAYRPGHNPNSTSSIDCSYFVTVGGVLVEQNGLDEEGDPANPGHCDGGIKTYYMPGLLLGPAGTYSNPLSQGVTGFSDEAPSPEGKNNVLFDTKDLNGNGIIDTTNQYLSYGVRQDWTGWRLVKIPIDFLATEGFHTTSDGLSYFFHNQNSFGTGTTSPIIHTARLWMTGASSTEVAGNILVESLQLSKNRWEARVDAAAVTDLGADTNSTKFDVSSISKEQNSSYDATLRFIQLTTGQDQNTVLNTEKSLKISYNLSDEDFDPRHDPSGKPIYFATRTYSSALDFTDYADLKVDLEPRAVSEGDVLFIRLENDSNNYYQYNIPISPKSLTMYSWNAVGAKIDGSDHNRVVMGMPFLNKVNQISIGVLSPNPSTGVSREIWINNLRVSGATEREGVAKRFNTTNTLGNNLATISTRYREVDGGFSQLDQTGTRYQLSKENGVDLTSNSIKVWKEIVNIQGSISTSQKLTENQYKDEPFFFDLPEIYQKTSTGSISYSKLLPLKMGRLTTLRLSGSDTKETDAYLPAYMTQAGVQGSFDHTIKTWTLASVYDAPQKIGIVPIGNNQFSQNFTSTKDQQTFVLDTTPDFERQTRDQSYAWTNTTEILKRLVLTPGYSWAYTEAKGNTTYVGQASYVPDYMGMQKRIQPKAGVMYRNFFGLTPSVTYTGSVLNDFTSFSGARLTNSNNLNYTVSFTPGSFMAWARKINLNMDGGRTEAANATIQNFDTKRPLTFSEKWGLRPPVGIAYTSTQSLSHVAHASFTLLDRLSFRPSGTWSRQYSVLSEGSNPTRNDTRTLGLSATYTHHLLTIPYAKFSLRSAEFNFNRNDAAAFDSSVPQQLNSSSSQRIYSIAFPYDINLKAEGRIQYQKTRGESFSTGVYSWDNNDSYTVEYIQKFLQNKTITLPFVKWKLRFHQAMELHLTLMTETDRHISTYVLNEILGQRYKGTAEINYNALKNIRLGLSISRENYIDHLDSTKSYNAWSGTFSLEARF
jgi:hypothetical protein